MADLGVGTISSSSPEIEFLGVFPSIGSTIPSISHSEDSGYSYPIDSVGINSLSIISFASTIVAFSAPFTSNSGVTTNVSFSGITSTIVFTTEQIDLNIVRPMWKSYVFVGISARPSFGQVFPR
jgi:hypothetical protein